MGGGAMLYNFKSANFIKLYHKKRKDDWITEKASRLRRRRRLLNLSRIHHERNGDPPFVRCHGQQRRRSRRGIERLDLRWGKRIAPALHFNANRWSCFVPTQDRSCPSDGFDVVEHFYCWLRLLDERQWRYNCYTAAPRSAPLRRLITDLCRSAPLFKRKLESNSISLYNRWDYYLLGFTTSELEGCFRRLARNLGCNSSSGMVRWQDHPTPRHLTRNDTSDPCLGSYASGRFQVLLIQQLMLSGSSASAASHLLHLLLSLLLIASVRHGRGLSNDEEDAGVADDDGQARKDKRHDEQELLWWTTSNWIRKNGTGSNLFVQPKTSPLTLRWCRISNGANLLKHVRDEMFIYQ